MSSLDLELVRHALAVARQRGYSEIELAADGCEFKAVLEPAPTLSFPTPPASDRENADLTPILAGLVGYYKAAKPALKTGKKIKEGDVVGEITALGIDNDVEAPATGQVVQVLVKDGDAVEFGQTLAVVKVGE